MKDNSWAQKEKKNQMSYCLLVGLVFIHLSHVLVKIPFGHRLCLGIYSSIPLWMRKYKCHAEFQNYISRGFKMHEGTRVDVRRCESVTKHVYMYYGAFVLWCSSSSVDIKKATTIILNRVLIREANKCKEVKSCSPTLETGNHLGPYWMESRLDQLE